MKLILAALALLSVVTAASGQATPELRCTFPDASPIREVRDGLAYAHPASKEPPFHVMVRRVDDEGRLAVTGVSYDGTKQYGVVTPTGSTTVFGYISETGAGITGFGGACVNMAAYKRAPVAPDKVPPEVATFLRVAGAVCETDRNHTGVRKLYRGLALNADRTTSSVFVFLKPLPDGSHMAVLANRDVTIIFPADTSGAVIFNKGDELRQPASDYIDYCR
jgi:hypothetical protein